ncbi:MAG TPA: YncE family protein [Burkholderiaceae bacterium]
MKIVLAALLALPLAAAMGNTLAAAPAAIPSYKVTHSIAVGGEARWDYVALDSAAHRLYVSHGTQTEVIDLQSEKVIGTIADTEGVHGIAVASDLGLGFTSNGKSNSITVFDLATLKTRNTIKVGIGPDAIVYAAAGSRVVTFNGRSKDATVIDAKSGTVAGTVAIGGRPEYALAGRDGKVYLNVEDTGELAVLDPVALKIGHRNSLKPCDGPSGLAMDSNERLYSVCDNKMMIVSTGDGKRLAQVPIGAGPDGAVWLDGQAFSANGADGTITVAGEDASGQFQVQATIPTAPGARTIAADPVTHRLYLPVADYKPAQAGERRQGIPGTFRILVLERQ